MKKHWILFIIISIIVLQIFIKDAFNIVSFLFNKPIELVITISDQIKSYNYLYQSYQNNKESIIKSKMIEQENINLKEHLKELMALNKIESNTYDYFGVKASIISRNINNWEDIVIVNKGSKSGIKKGMAVVNNKGLIGRISETSNYSSKVELITTNDTKISVKVNEEYGVLVPKNGHFYLEGITKEIELGSVVMTSGLTESFPSGILIGEIVGSHKDHYNLTTIYEVKIHSDLNKMNYLTILIRNNHVDFANN